MLGTMREPQVDSPYAWIIVISAFASHVITHGIIYSFGLLFLALEERFPGTTTSEIAWIPSMISGALHLIGPIASMLVNRYGFRKVTVLGTLVSALGFGVSGYVHNIYILYLTLGIMAGCGFGLVFLSAVLSVTCYFDKYRSMACSIALCGAGGGAFIFSPLVAWLLQAYSLQGTLLIMSSVILNCIPCALMFKPVQSKNDTERSAVQDNTVYSRNDEKKVQDLLLVREKGDCKIMSSSKSPQLVNHNSFVQLCKHGKRDFRSSHDTVGDPEAVVIETIHTDVLHGKRIETMYFNGTGLNFFGTDDFHKHNKKGPLARQFGLLKYKITSLFFTAQFLFLTGFYLPFIYIPDKAINEGIEETQVAWVASTIGLSSIAGRIILGYVADLPSVDRIMLYKVTLLIAGGITLFGPLLTTFTLLIGYAVIYGFFTGSYISLTSVVLVDLVGVDLVADAYGMNNLFSGVGCLIGAPFTGFLFDLTRNHDVVFIVPGLSLVSGAVILFLMPCCNKTSKTF